MKFITAKCACGQIRFESVKEPVIQVCCHCEDCRDATTMPFSKIAFFKLDSVTISGSVAAKEYVAESGSVTKREFCPQCEEVLFDKSGGFPGLIGVFINKIEPPFAAGVGVHVWTASKKAGVVIPQGVEVYEKGIS